MSTYTRINTDVVAARIVEFLSDQRDPVSGREVARALDMKYPTVMCHLATLEDINWVGRVGEYYEVGQRLATIWARRLAQLKAQKSRIERDINELEA
jgi:DNA-binding IclR family transcriptional regulator